MASIKENKLAPKTPSSLAKRGLCSLAAVAFLILFFTSQAFGQMGSSVIYSDIWSDYDYVYSCGVTQDNYNSYCHTYWVQATLTSPNGHTASATSYRSSSYNAYVRVDLSLPWDDEDVGDFTETTQHWMQCPYIGGGGFRQAQLTHQSERESHMLVTDLIRAL